MVINNTTVILSKVFINTTLATLLAQPTMSFGDVEVPSKINCEQFLPNYLEQIATQSFNPLWKVRFENCKEGSLRKTRLLQIDDMYTAQAINDSQYRKISTDGQNPSPSNQYDFSNASQFKKRTSVVDKGNSLEGLPGYITISE